MSLATGKSAAASAEQADVIVNYKPAYIAMFCLGVFYVGIRILRAGFRLARGSRLVRAGVPDLLAEHPVDGDSA